MTRAKLRSMGRGRKSRRSPGAIVMSKVPYLLVGGAIGIIGTYLFDPDRGRSRRAKIQDQAAGRARRIARGADRKSRYAAGHLRGVAEEAQRKVGIQKERTDLDDLGLAKKVESLLFSDPSIPKGRISVNAEAGVIFLRGTCDTPDQINRLEEEARKVAGVVEVRNLLHLKGTRAPLR